MYRTHKKIVMVANVSMFRSLSPGVIGPEFRLKEVDIFHTWLCGKALCSAAFA